MTRVSHGLDRIDATFDDPSLVGSAGLLLVATLSVRLGLEALIEQLVRLGDRPGAANPGAKVLSLVHAMVDQADTIDGCDRLRAGATAKVLDHRVLAPSTLGTFLRAFTFGHVRQLEAVVGRAIERAWAAGAGPADGAVTVIDIDSTICPVYGTAKGGASFTYTRVLGYHPLLATLAATGEVLHARLRRGGATSARGCVRFVEELVARVRRAGGDGPICVRADSGFYVRRLLDTFSRLEVGFCVTSQLRNPQKQAIAAIAEPDWWRIDYPDGIAHVAEFCHGGRRYIVRRVRNHDHRDPQGQLFDTWRYHAFVTNLAGPAWQLDQFHRAHAIVELSIRDLKAGPLAHLPSGQFNANGAWLTCATLAHNLTTWTATLGELAGSDQLTVGRTFHNRYLHLPGRLVNRSGRPTLRLPNRWPWARQWTRALEHVRAVPLTC